MLPLPIDDMNGARRKVAEYSGRATFSRALYCLLPVSKIAVVENGDVGWVAGEVHLLCSSAALAWTEHSERGWLDSATFAVSFKKDAKNFLGLWVPV